MIINFGEEESSHRRTPNNFDETDYKEERKRQFTKKFSRGFGCFMLFLTKSNK